MTAGRGNGGAVGVVGVGYVGLVTAACFADLGHDVVCCDVNPDRIDALRAGKVPIYEPGVEPLLQRNRARLTFTLELADVLERCRIVFVCVDTPPTASGDADLSRVEAVVAGIPATGVRHVLVMKSTVPVGTGEKVRLELNARGLDQIGYVSNPEFLREGRAVADFMQPDRIVIGASDAADGQAVADLYRRRARRRCIRHRRRVGRDDQVRARTPSSPPRSRSSTRSRTCARRSGRTCRWWRAGMGLDDRIGPHFLRPGIGYGGSCFPKDVHALKQLAGNSGYHFQLLTAVIEVNELQKRRVVGKLERHLGGRSRGTPDRAARPGVQGEHRRHARGVEPRAVRRACAPRAPTVVRATTRSRWRTPRSCSATASSWPTRCSRR